MTGVAAFNAGTVVVVVVAIRYLVRMHVREWRASRFAAPSTPVVEQRPDPRPSAAPDAWDRACSITALSRGGGARKR